MADKMPYGGDRKTQNHDRAERILGYKSGGRISDEKGTKISISIGQPQQGGQGTNPAAAGALMAGLAQAAKPPMPVGGPPPGAPPGLPPGGGPPAPPMGMKRGGRARSAADMTAGAMSGEGRLQKTEIASRGRKG